MLFYQYFGALYFTLKKLIYVFYEVKNKANKINQLVQREKKNSRMQVRTH